MVVWNEFRNDARVLKEAETLQSKGYQVTVHALHTPGVTEERETLSSGVRVVRVARSPLWKWRKRKEASALVGAKVVVGPIGKVSLLRQALRVIARLWTHLGLIFQVIKSKPDVVHAHDVNTLPTAWVVSVLTRSPLVYDAHEISTDREGYSSFRKLVGWVEKRLMPRAVATITTTDVRAKFFARAYGIPRPVVLQNRPNLTRVKGSNRLREELGLKESWPIVLYQGGLQQGRGLERLLRVAKHVEHCYFVFIGGGRLELLLRDLSVELRLSERVFFIPTVALADLPTYTASADIGIQPIENTCLNHFSTDSNKLFEYIMAGLPVIASDFPEIRKVVKNYDVGLLAGQSETELVEVIKMLITQPELIKRFRKNALESADQLSWEDQECKLLDMYAEIFAAN